MTSANDTVTVAKVTPTLNVSNNAVSTGGNLVFTATVTGPANGATPTGTPAWTITSNPTGTTSCTGGTAGPTGGANVASYTCTITGVKASSTYSASFSYRATATTTRPVPRSTTTPRSRRRPRPTS